MAGPAEPQRFKGLFMNPSVEEMYALTPKEFEKFVAYVFRRAGFAVQDVSFHFTKGVDLELFGDGSSHSRSGGIEVKRLEPSALVTSQTVQKLMGAPAVRKGKAAAYLVTTSGFNKAAYAMAAHGKRTYLLNGEQLCRYIRYVRGSRYDETTGIRVLIPPDRFCGSGLLWQRATHHTKVLAVANNKGGVGKTTTARHLALGLAAKGKQVLLVDMDPQGNLTESFLDTASDMVTSPHLAQYFAGECSLGQLVRGKTEGTNIMLIPAHPDLSLLDTGGAGRPELEVAFLHDLFDAFATTSPPHAHPFDWIILDTPPAISAFTRCALAAADYVLAPARSRPSSLAGIRNMLRTMDTMGELTGQAPRMVGCLLTHWGEDESSKDTYIRLGEIFDNRKSRILATRIPFDVTIEKTHGPTQHRASEAYSDAIEEVLNYV